MSKPAEGAITLFTLALQKGPLPAEILYKIAASGPGPAQYQLAQRSDLPDDLWNEYANSPYPGIRKMIATNKSAPEPYKIIASLNT